MWHADPIYPLIVIWLVTVNLAGAAAIFIDKWLAKHNRWRIRERTLFLYCWLGGCPLVYTAMKLCHHKTKHRSFMWGIPAIFLLQIVIISIVLYILYQKGVWVI